jgi:8-oxo-dGTP diphosphatase
MWEFPGGKIEAGETPQEALHREIEEELECEVRVGKKVTTSEAHYSFGTVILTTFVCHLISGTPHLTEHEEIAWLEPSKMPTVEAWAPADREAVGIITAPEFVLE